MAHPFRYSMVVDAAATHPYQAQLLLRTLGENAAVPPEAVTVQCTSRVGEEVLEAFRHGGHAVVRIEPYLDGRYCNKIAQLDCFAGRLDAAVEGVFLLDLDMAVAGPLDLPEPSAVCGKVVDGDNPDLTLIEALFGAAGVPLPEVVPCDWAGRGDTVATNLNGGFIYLPRGRLAPLRAAWRKWAEFLFARPTLFGARAEREPAFKHVDQLALALALASESAPVYRLPTNWNFPCHRHRQPRLYRQQEPLRVLHYHDCLDEFGLLAPTASGFEAVDVAVEKVNASIGAGLGGPFFELFKQQRAREALRRVPVLSPTPFSAGFLARMAVRPSGRQRRLILHAGAPKTGTSSLQRHLGLQREQLAGRGWWYPPPSDTPEPKHQRLNALLRRGNAQSFAAYVEDALRDMPDDAHTVLFTTEGIFNHWWDYAPWAKAALRQLAALFDFELCVWFRPPVPFATALYVQYLGNPPTEDEPRHVYGRDIGFAAALSDPWFRRHLDCLGFLHEARLLFGDDRVRPFLFGDDTVQAFIDEYGVPLPVAHQRRNRSLGSLGTELLRIVNRARAPAAERDRVLGMVRDIDAILGEESAPVELDDRQREAVHRYAQRGWRAVRAAMQPGPKAVARRRHRRLKGKVFCIGFHGTGIDRLAPALRLLGYRAVGRIGGQETAIGDDLLAKALSIATEFDAFSDNPWPLLYRELDATFPGSKFVLTTCPTSAWIDRVVARFGDRQRPMRAWIYGAGQPRGNERRYIERYERHNQAVRRYFRERGDLLVMNLDEGDGWPELCGFLGAAPPNAEFPQPGGRGAKRAVSRDDGTADSDRPAS